MIKRRSSQSIPLEIQNKLDMFFEDLKAVGVTYIGHGIINDQGDHTGYFSHKSWGQLYILNNYFFTEPILENYKEEKMNLIPWGNLGNANGITNIRNNHMNITSGMTICKNEAGYKTFFNVGITGGKDIIEFAFFKRDLLLSYFAIFNSYHLLWRREKGI
jgi:hypothetical protein